MKNKNLLSSFKYAFSGIWSAFRSERNMKIHLFISIIVTILALILEFSLIEMTILVLVMALVICLELVNTAIEKIVDLIVGDTRHQLAKEAKDIGSGAVLIASIASVIIGIILFGRKIF